MSRFDITLSVQNVEKIQESIESDQWVGAGGGSGTRALTKGETAYNKAVRDPRLLAMRYEEYWPDEQKMLFHRKTVNRAVRFSRMGVELFDILPGFKGEAYTTALLQASHMGHLVENMQGPGAVAALGLYLLRIFRELKTTYEKAIEKEKERLEKKLQETANKLIVTLEEAQESVTLKIEKTLKEKIDEHAKSLEWMMEFDKALGR